MTYPERFTTILYKFTLLPADDGQTFHVTPGDAGGATAWGVTIPLLTDYLRRPAQLSDIRALTYESVADVYFTQVWSKLNCGSMKPGPDAMVFDFGVLAGVPECAKLLQSTVGVQVDDDIGEETLTAMGRFDQRELIVQLGLHQATHDASLQAFKRFGNGWLGRDARGVLFSLSAVQ